MKTNAYPGYEYHLNLYDIIAHGSEAEKSAALEAQRKYISDYTLPDGMTMKDITIDGPDGDPLRLRIYTPEGLPRSAPMLLEIHGGGWVGGSLDIDNYRCIYLACHTPCIVVGVDYRLAGDKLKFPAPLMDCYAALNWIYEHSGELGGYNGALPNYYAMPGYCRDLKYLSPTCIIVAEYDPLRDDGLAYAGRLMQEGVPCEVIIAPRVGHGFCVVDHPLTRWVHNGICASMRREFGMEVIDF